MKALLLMIFILGGCAQYVYEYPFDGFPVCEKDYQHCLEKQTWKPINRCKRERRKCEWNIKKRYFWKR